MLKNCSRCKGRHVPPYGQYCKHASLTFCVHCVCRHEPPVGPDCESVRRTQLFIDAGTPSSTMSRSTPISERFKERSDPDYLSYLEEQVEALQKSKQGETDISYIVRRLEALELAQQRYYFDYREWRLGSGWTSSGRHGVNSCSGSCCRRGSRWPGWWRWHHRGLPGFEHSTKRHVVLCFNPFQTPNAK